MKTGDRNRSLLLNQSCEVVGNHVCQVIRFSSLGISS